jgi:MFS family permease
VFITGGLIALAYGIVRSDTLGWAAAGVIGPIASAVVLLGAFVYVEARVASAPLVPLSIFRHGQLRTANVVVVLLYAAFFPVWFFLTIYLQQIMGYDALQAGVAFLPMTLTIFVASSLAPRAVARVGSRRVIASGMATASAGMLLLTGLHPDAGYFGVVLAGATLTSLGMGFSLVPATIVAMEGVPSSESGLASGLLNTSRLMGGALGLAVLSTIADSHTPGASTAGAHALTDGFDLAFGVGALLCIAGATLAATMLRVRPRVALAEGETQTA